MIKFLDLKLINKRYEKEFKAKFEAFLNSGQYILGNEVLNFEAEFAAYCGTTFCIGTSNGLDALQVIFEAYKVLGKLKVGDEVIVPANTYIASILAISHTGLKPVLVEPDINTYNIDVSCVERAITPLTKAVLGVHLYGQLYQVNTLEKLCKANNLLLIEDAAQAHGAIHLDGKKAGNMSNAAAFSFYPTKNLGALGDAGAITTNNKELAETIQKLRNYGRSSTYKYDLKGYNCRMDELQAAFLRAKLKDLDADNAKRIANANAYLRNISNLKIKLPFYSTYEDHVFHQFVIRVDDRKAFMNYMSKHNIETSIHYPLAPHEQKAFSSFKGCNLPITTKIHEEVVSLPINSALTSNEIKEIIKVINKY